MECLFVYGSLRRGTDGRLHPLLLSECTFLAVAHYRGILYDLGPYPAVVPSDRPDDLVTGELYRIAEPGRVLPRLDAFEGAPYVRERCEVMTVDGTRSKAWIYLYRGPLHDAVRIASGDYLAP